MGKEKFKRQYFNIHGQETKDGDYVLTPVLQEDGSFSFWLAKKGYVVAMYCFTIGHGGLTHKQQIKEIKQDIKLYNNLYLKTK